MADWNPESLCFSTLGPKDLVADFQGGRLTTDAGALLLRELANRSGLFDALNAVIPDPRNPGLTVHDPKSLLAQRIFALAPGSEDLNDHQTLRADPARHTAVARSPEPELTLASPPTLGRLEDRVDRSALVRGAAALVDHLIAAHPAPPEHLMLDFDATDDPTHGHQERRSFHGYYDHHCYLPLYASCGDEWLVASLRRSDIDACKQARAVLKLLVRKRRAAGPDVRITIRADSGSCRWRLRRRCDAHGIGSILGLAKDPVLERLAREEIERAERQFRRTGVPQRIFGAFASAAGSWDRRRRVIVKAEHTAQGKDPRLVVANVPGDPQE